MTYIFVGSLFLMISCIEVIVGDPETLKLEELNRRIDEFKLEQIRSCKEEALMDAESYVDSVLFSEVNVELLDSINMIVKPPQPYRPQYIKDIDTTKISPFFDRGDAVSLDSL